MSFAAAFKTMASTLARPMAVKAPAMAARAQFGRVTPALRAAAPKARAFHAAQPAMAKYGNEKKGDFPSMEFRIFFNEDGKAISPWHGVPLKNADGTFNFICEIPKETKAKMEVATDEELTPIKQDTKKGKLRDYPYNINWNYGMLPQTWEDPGHEHPEMKVMGDNDPVVSKKKRDEHTISHHIIRRQKQSAREAGLGGHVFFSNEMARSSPLPYPARALPSHRTDASNVSE